LLGERHRALLGDVRVGGDRHDEDIAERLRFFEMQDMANVHEIERAVTLYDLLAAEVLAKARQLLERDDLAAAANVSRRELTHRKAASPVQVRARPSPH